MKPQVLIIAAEASSGLFAQRLIEHWKNDKNDKSEKSGKKDLHFFGVGTPEMERIGFERLGKSEEMAVVGVVEVLEAYRHLKSVFNKIVDEVHKRKPRLIILMDYPGFNLRLAKALHSTGIPIVYYIAPQVWAWKTGRVQQIRQYCRKVLVILPFELDFFKKHQVPTEFVGHPLLDEIRPELYDPKVRSLQRQRRGVADADFVVGLMPGSRRGELERNFPIQLKTAAILKRKYTNLKVIVFVAPTLTLEEVQSYLSQVSFDVQVIKDEPFQMIQLADLILAASGTATLMVAMLGVPMVIMYRLNWLTGIMARVLVRGIKYFGLPNLVLNREVVPERWQSQASPEKLAVLLMDFMNQPDKLKSVGEELKKIPSLLGQRGATKRVAKSLEEFL